MPRHLLPGLLVFSLFLCAASPRAAADPRVQVEHPYVGLALFASNGSISHTCGGVMLSPRVFLTSGWCTAGADMALVWTEVERDFDPRSGAVGQPMSHPAFDDFAGYPNSSDLGVVLLDEPVDLPAYAVLPALGAFDGAAEGPSGPFTSLSFGLEAVVPFMQAEYVRITAHPFVAELGQPPTDGYHLNLIPNAPRARRDTACLGERGRPAFIGSTNVLAGIASVVSTSGCQGAAFYVRLDTPFAQEFVRGFLR